MAKELAARDLMSHYPVVVGELSSIAETVAIAGLNRHRGELVSGALLTLDSILRTGVLEHPDPALEEQALEATTVAIEVLTSDAPEFDRVAGLVHQSVALRKVEASVKQLRADLDVATDAKFSEKMSTTFTTRADANQTAWTAARWEMRLALALTLAVAVALYFALPHEGPEGKALSAGQAISNASLTLLLLGVCFFFVRLASQSYRAQRALEVTNRQKADALATFAPLVAGIEDEKIRGEIAAAVAAYVYSRDPNGYENEGPSVTPSDGVLTAAINRINAK